MGHEADFGCHFAASTVAAVINFPLWRASAIAQSGFKLEGSNFMSRYYQAAIKPPFKGVAATIAGMAWARGAIFCKCGFYSQEIELLSFVKAVAVRCLLP